MGEESRQVQDNVSYRLQLRHDAATLLGELLCADETTRVELHYRTLLAFGRDLLAVVPRFLERAEPRDVARLGALLAAYPDRPAVVAALRRVALAARTTDTPRRSAMVILEQWLGQALGLEFYAGLRSPAQVVVDALAGGSGDRNILLTYLDALEEQQPGSLYSLLGALAQQPDHLPLEVLRLLAQHDDEQVANRAMTILIDSRHEAALLVLRILQFVLPPQRRERLARSLRKHSMIGHALPPFALPAGARALQTPLDGQGYSAIWFIVPRDDGTVRLLSVLLSDEQGIREAFGGDDFAAASFPSPGPPGTIYQGIEAPPGPHPDAAVAPIVAASDDAAGPDSDAAGPFEPPQPFDFMEVDFDYARARLLEYQQLNWDSSEPLPMEYRLLHDIVWRFGPPAPPELRLPRPAAQARTAELTMLFATPCFRSWHLRGSSVYDIAANMLGRQGKHAGDGADPAVPDGDMMAAAASLANDYFTPTMRARLARRLQRSAEWLLIAGEADHAALALLAARQMTAAPPSQTYFGLLLAERGIRLALEELTTLMDAPELS